MPKKLYIGYATKTTLELIQHMYTQYAHISAKYIASNNKILLSSYNAEELLEGLIERLNEWANFEADAIDMVSES